MKSYSSRRNPRKSCSQNRWLRGQIGIRQMTIEDVRPIGPELSQLRAELSQRRPRTEITDGPLPPHLELVEPDRAEAELGGRNRPASASLSPVQAEAELGGRNRPASASLIYTPRAP